MNGDEPVLTRPARVGESVVTWKGYMLSSISEWAIFVTVIGTIGAFVLETHENHPHADAATIANADSMDKRITRLENSEDARRKEYFQIITLLQEIRNKE